MDQSAYNNLQDDFYNTIVSYIPANGSLLNIGCGALFSFEKILDEQKKLQITSVDILKLDKPSYIEEYIKLDIEKLKNFDRQFDVITFFELIEHIDNTDILLQNAYNNLKDDGLLIFSHPNLSSILSRLELLFGYQPHLLEVSNIHSNFGTGLIGKYNNPENKSIHHIRGITYKAMTEMLNYNEFCIIKTIGYDFRFKKIFNYMPSISAQVFFVCQKK